MKTTENIPLSGAASAEDSKATRTTELKQNILVQPWTNLQCKEPASNSTNGNFIHSNTRCQFVKIFEF